MPLAQLCNRRLGLCFLELPPHMPTRQRRQRLAFRDMNAVPRRRTEDVQGLIDPVLGGWLTWTVFGAAPHCESPGYNGILAVINGVARLTDG